MQQSDPLAPERARTACSVDTKKTPHGSTARVIPIVHMSAGETEVARQMQICNACRYCEGFCAVFPAMTRRLEFGKADVNYLANLCHNCGACYHACQYAPPHEFGVNVPKAMAEVRLETYTEYAFPASFGALYKRNGLTLSVALAAGIALFLLLGTALRGGLSGDVAPANFYAIFPHGLLAAMFGIVFLFAILALGLGVTRFWRDVSAGTASASAPAVAEAARNALTLKYLDGGHGDGCNEEDDAFTLARRRFHHLTFYGFMLCFAATAVATLYHYAFGLEAPYPFLSVPVLMGTAGGIGLIAGPAGLLWLNLKRVPERGDPRQRPMDRGFIALLLLTSASGLALLALRTTSAMPSLLAIHLGIVMALFATLPYGKFAHGIFRSAALLKSSLEKRQRSTLNLGSD
ncbi:MULTISPECIES: tricarballylate utilization 4Fe-4S protein TcuB [unclassified Burkholderia]|uniref:tricarballylate utilization 4Fe-4S protein TcuB n=1 Tax=unclassified Burkholderia TaxID=2613784 RepID=UPI000F595634|nr:MULTISPECIES: tricarballylate utilization 4Fe-4S protein TcuB [unclassified Burkholderia]RQR33692.1 tricarballylate utilization 4Fe-4S protein TcuB [Burkholderia sp. Bp9131]RQR65752.1 tricarballylate utilization 4Fe-4S protein TcuB [Burkholderia sp. Bp9015]RQR92848.1 tricarballylate utilization 4Fe-4S protein TcuB [Burkholderia sp. Bp8994]RQS20904.1 tricarballylate utilization 4Fe-4S protein TcuB [Burkholderia sp. Bp8995]RQS37567.1 tricarballylate utilization 4Fe-4S protein TcuB [Burkholder